MKTVVVILLFCFCYSIVNAQKIETPTRVYAKVQYAGSIGFLSAGLGYVFFKNKINTELMYGNVPISKGGPLDIATFRIIYNPVTFNLTKSVSIIPLNVSGFVTYHFGDQFFVKLPEQYYKDYYKWSSAIRYHLGFGSMVNYKSKNSGHGFALYYELNTNDLYIKSLKANNTLTIGDILSLGVGVKIY